MNKDDPNAAAIVESRMTIIQRGYEAIHEQGGTKERAIYGLARVDPWKRALGRGSPTYPYFYAGFTFLA